MVRDVLIKLDMSRQTSVPPARARHRVLEQDGSSPAGIAHPYPTQGKGTAEKLAESREKSHPKLKLADFTQLCELNIDFFFHS